MPLPQKNPAAIDIRPAENADVQALYSLAGAAGSRKEPGYFERCLEEQQDKKREVYIVVAGGKSAGYGMLNWRPRYALYQKLGVPEIQDLNVMPPARRQGLATALIAHCERMARERGCAHIGISVGLTASYGAAQILYTRLGYLPDGNGVTYDRQPVAFGEVRAVDDNLCLMMVKEL